jgi:receptor protein-tyrosine kinase
VVVGAVIGDLLGELTQLAGELARRSREGRRVTVLTSAQRGEGRSTLLLVLARTAAACGLKVAIVDGDFRRPQLAELLGIDPPGGWEDVLSGHARLHDVMIESLEESITLLPLRAPTGHEATLGLGGECAESLTRLREQFDLVLMDIGPLESDQAAVDLAAVLHRAEIDDCLVIRDAATSSQSTGEIVRRLHAVGIQQWELLENFV